MSVLFENEIKELRKVKGKYESMYIFVVYDAPIELIVEKVTKVLGILDQIQNVSKKNYIKKKIYAFNDYLANVKPGSKLDNIFFIDDVISMVELSKKCKDTLKHFQCDPIAIKYGESYQIDWLKDYLFDDTYTNVLYIKNNDLKHYHLNTTKKRLHTTYSAKSMDIGEYIAENIPPKEICVVHGVSSALKSFGDSDDGFVKVYKTEKKDNDILLDVEISHNNTRAKILDQWLSKLLDPKDGSKIVFGKEIKTCIQNNMLKTLFCSPDVAEKVNEKIDNSLKVFDIVVIKDFPNDTNTTATRLTREFNGAVGIKFY